MTTVFKVIFAGVLGTGALLAGNTISAIAKEVKTGNLLVAQAPVKLQAIALPIALPDFADISLKGGESLSGRVIEVDAQGQTLTIQRSSKTRSIPLGKIEKVKFKNASTYISRVPPIIRGEPKRPTGKQVTWNGVPVDTFKIKNPAKGEAEVTLAPPVVSRAELLGIKSVAKDRQYVVDQLQFDPQKRTMTIQATPY
ncbi:hypothetical protein IQ259_11045 [Fortiea sp. LEGE XX443]|uniref:hypothetical protein n=1 Tax=Fortiea sp. LEGE XX443 TaxID=1828611 RepID=UPI00187E7A14|nr:hypothetical protein [Fortiea sp. LEGE XX443]MBE9005567.1 hypothetical protein [Fortiea sp. LEGE XX443]